MSGPVAMTTLSQPSGGSPPTDFAPFDLDQRIGAEGFRYGGGKRVPVDRERAAGGNLVGVGAGQDQRAATAHLLVQQADRVIGGIVGAEGIGAHQLGKPVGLVGIGAAFGAHFVENDRHPGARDLPGSLGTCKTAADDVNRLPRVAHASSFSTRRHRRLSILSSTPSSARWSRVLNR